MAKYTPLMQLVEETVDAQRRLRDMGGPYQRGRLVMGIMAISAITGMSQPDVRRYVLEQAGIKGTDHINPLVWKAERITA